MENIVLEMKGIVKAFHAVRVLNKVDFELQRGEVHALLGANGAGKSTLVKILNGIYTSNEGEILLHGQRVFFKNPRDAFAHGVAIIHQELDLVNNLSVAENMFLGREIMDQRFGSVDRLAMNNEAQHVLDSLNFEIQAKQIVGELSPARQQLVMIARVVAMEAQIVVMDEPTSSLSFNEIENLYKVIEGLQKHGISIIYISHYLDEVFRIADRVTVLRNGEKIQVAAIDECTEAKIVEWMVGHADVKRAYHRMKPKDHIVLTVDKLSQQSGIVEDVSFQLREGEVLGLSGVVGSGRTELAKMIFGAEPIREGKILLEGVEVRISSPEKAVAAGIAFIPENRTTEGLIINHSIHDNLALVTLHEKTGVLNHKAIHSAAKGMMENLRIRCESALQQVRRLSGGNQQKVVLGKWLSVKSNVVILDQPTRGVDVGVKEEIYALVDSLAKEGVSILLISDELEELLNLTDRILVMKRGRIVREFDNSERQLGKPELLASMIN